MHAWKLCIWTLLHNSSSNHSHSQSSVSTSCIWSSKDFQVIPFLHPSTSLTLQIDFFFNKLTPGNELAIVLWFPKPWDAAGADWTGFTFSCRTKTHWLQSPGGEARLLLRLPCAFPASSLPPCSSTPASSTEELVQDVGIRNSNPAIHQRGVSKSAGLMLSQCHLTKCWGKKRKNLPPKCQDEKRSVIFGCELKLPIQRIWCLSPPQTWSFRAVD